MCVWCESGSAQQFPLLERVRSKCKGNKEQIVARKIIDFTGTLLMQQFAIAKSKGKSETLIHQKQQFQHERVRLNFFA